LDRRLLPPDGEEGRILSPALAALLIGAAALPAVQLVALPAAQPAERSGAALAADTSPRNGARGQEAHDLRADGAPAPREAARRALERGLAWLATAAASSSDGSLPKSGARDPAPVAVTALAALAWMAGGNTPDRGPQGRELGLAIDWLVEHTDLDPRSETYGYVALRGDGLSRMHGHGLAALALSQAAGTSPKSERGARIARALDAAIACIERSQGVEGGWWYVPEKSLEHEGSITISEVQALRAAHNAGFKVNPLTIARALDYLARSQKPDGSFRYALGDDHSTLALTAAAVATLNAAGKYEGKSLEEAFGYLLRGLSARETWIEAHPNTPFEDRRLPEERDERHPWCSFYERLYLAQALWQHPDRDAYDRWAALETKSVLVSQREDGSWHDERFGDAYATANDCLVLALPEGLLPIFQR
jgi:hypothetical protein